MGNPTNGQSLQKQGHEHEHPGANCKCSHSHHQEGHTEVRYLIRNLPSRELFQKIRRAERRKEAGERELGFYLLDLRYLIRKCRRAYKKVASSFHQFIVNRTGLEPSKAGRLVRVALALESLPLMDQAFARGELYWSAVRAMARVAKPQDEDRWVEFARTHRVREVEQRVATARAGEAPEEPRWGGSPTRFPYRFNATPELHQGIEALAEILTLKTGCEVTVVQAIEQAVKEAVKRQIHGNDVDDENGKDGDGGGDSSRKGRKRVRGRELPSSFRLVIQFCARCKEWAVFTPGGPVTIPEERGRALAEEALSEGAEILPIEPAQIPPGFAEKICHVRDYEDRSPSEASISSQGPCEPSTPCDDADVVEVPAAQSSAQPAPQSPAPAEGTGRALADEPGTAPAEAALAEAAPVEDLDLTVGTAPAEDKRPASEEAVSAAAEARGGAPADQEGGAPAVGARSAPAEDRDAGPAAGPEATPIAPGFAENICHVRDYEGRSPSGASISSKGPCEPVPAAQLAGQSVAAFEERGRSHGGPSGA